MSIDKYKSIIIIICIYHLQNIAAWEWGHGKYAWMEACGSMQKDAHLTGYGKVGNKCHVECSNRGICDHSNGICDCFNGFIGSACERVNVLAGIN